MESTGGGIRFRKPLRVPERRGGRREEAEAEAEAEAEGEPLSPAARLFHEPHFNCYVIAILGSGKRIDVAAAKVALESSLVRHPRFSSVQVFSEEKLGKWVPVKVNVDDHVIVPEVDPRTSDPDRFIEDYAAALTKTTMDLSKPLWEVHVLNVKTAEAEAVAVFRAHHSLGDGTSLISLLLACTRKTSDPGSLPTAPAAKRPVRFRGTGVFAYLVAVWTLLRMAWNTAVDFVLFVATFLFLKDSDTVLKGGDGVELRPRRFVHRTLELSDFRLVKSRLDTTINDVMLGVTSAGLSRYLSRRHKEDGGAQKRGLPKNILVRATVLVNIRSTPGIAAMANMMEKCSTGSEWGNWLGYVLLPFPIINREDPLDYVRKAKQIADRKKLSFESLFTFASSAVLVRSFGIKAAAALSHKVLSNTTMSFSNVVGPSEEISFCGHPVAYLAPSVYGHPHALTVHFQSYTDKVKLVLAVDEEAIPDPHQLCQDLSDSLLLIKEALLVAGSRDGA